MFPAIREVKNRSLFGYVDSDRCGDKIDRSTKGHVFKFQGTPTSWSSKKQSVVALSFRKAEYVAEAVG